MIAIILVVRRLSSGSIPQSRTCSRRSGSRILSLQQFDLVDGPAHPGTHAPDVVVEEEATPVAIIQHGLTVNYSKQILWLLFQKGRPFRFQIVNNCLAF